MTRFILIVLIVGLLPSALCARAEVINQGCAVVQEHKQSQAAPSVVIGSHGEQGYRPYMEDVCSAHDITIDGHVYAALFDGHGGAGAAEFAAKNLHANLKKFWSTGNRKQALEKAFVITHEQYTGGDGTTAVVVLVGSDGMYVANVGDSHAIVVRSDNTPRVVTREHKLDNADESARVKRAGGFAYNRGVTKRKRFDGFVTGDEPSWVYDDEQVSYLNGRLMVTRSLGDKGLCLHDSGLTAEPFVDICSFDSAVKFVLLASDGLWDVMTPAGVLAFVEQYMHEQSITYKDMTPARADDLAKALVNFCILHLDSSDNVSAMLLFPQGK